MRRATLLLLGCLLLSACTPSPPPPPPADTAPLAAATVSFTAARPATWAQPLPRPGLPNLHVVSDSLYRGGQPEPLAAGMTALQQLGVRTVVNLRYFHGEEEAARAAGLDYVALPFHPFAEPDPALLARFIAIVTDPARTPVYVHCLHGSDRTGTAVAVYRMVVQHWTAAAAEQELRAGGYGFHDEWYESYARFVAALDTAALRPAQTP